MRTRSREGRHTAKASTWLLRYRLASNKDQAVKLVQRGKVRISGNIARTGVGYYKVKKEDIGVKD